MAIRKIRLGGEQLGRIQKKHAERAFEDKAIPAQKTEGLVASSNVKRIEILNELPPPELQEEGVLYGIYM